MNLWAASLLPYGGRPPFASAADLLAVIDGIEHGDAPWHSFTVCYTGPLPEGHVPTWMTKEYTIWTRDPRTLVRLIFDNEDFDGEFDYIPYCELDEAGRQRLTDFFSGNWVWRQAVRILFDLHLDPLRCHLPWSRSQAEDSIHRISSRRIP